MRDRKGFDRLMHHSGIGVIKLLEKLDDTQVITDLAVYTDNPEAQKLYGWYERLLITALVNPTTYLKVKAEEHIKIKDYIVENELYHVWSSLREYLSFISDTTTITNPSRVALMDELEDTWLTLSWDEKNSYVVGITKDGSQLIRRARMDGEIIDKMNALVVEKLSGRLSEKRYQEKMAKAMTGQVQHALNEERYYNKTMVNMLYYVNERTIACYPEDNKWLAHDSINVIGPREYFSEPDVMLEMCSNRKEALPAGGVLCELKNSGTFTKMFIMEDITPDGVFYAIFKASTREGLSTLGRFFPETHGFFTGFSSDGHEDKSQSLARLFLELYSDLTHGFSKDRKRLYALKEVDNLDDPTLNYTNMYVKYTKFEGKVGEGLNKRKGGKQTPHSRRMTDRKLPTGWHASKEALEEARRHGFALEEGKTFVRPYDVGKTDGKKTNSMSIFGKKDE